MNPKILRILVISLVCVLSGCSKNDPDSICESFLKSYLKGDFHTAQKYATAETGEMLQLLQQNYAIVIDSATMNECRNAKIRIISQQRSMKSDSSAIIFCKFTMNNRLDSTHVQMVKQQKHWRAKFPYTIK